LFEHFQTPVMMMMIMAMTKMI